MRLIKISIANIDTTVGALRSNTDKAIKFAKEAAEEGSAVCVFSEQVISGYPPEDLVQWKHFVRGQWDELERFSKETSKLNTVFVLGVAVSFRGAIYNCAAVVGHGNIYGIVPKEKLPTYNVFYEQRVFSKGLPGMLEEIQGVPFGDMIFDLSFGKMAVEVCEDLWSSDGPARRRAYSGAELIVNISSSPWRAGVTETRREIVSTRAAENIATLVYANQVGGNDSLVFDGGGFINQAGRMAHEAPRWMEALSSSVIDMDRHLRLRHENTTWRADQRAYLSANDPVRVIKISENFEAGDIYKYPASENKSFFIPDDKDQKLESEQYMEDLINACTMGLAGYFEKTKAFDRIGIALSGGKDSALSLLLAYIYAERKFAGLEEGEKKEKINDFIHCFSMPTRFNSEATRSIARGLCDGLGVKFVETPIEEVVSASEALLDKMHEGDVPSTAKQNIQARVRGAAMWNWANSSRGMWIQTGNMSEKAVGYTTIGGDMMGAYSLIGNMPKTVVERLLEYLHENKFSGLSTLGDLLNTKASAELSSDQYDEEDLMPFSVLDACYALFVGEKMEPGEVYKVLQDTFSEYEDDVLKEWVNKFIKLFRSSIFKWVQSPQTVHLGSLDLDRERALQLPVVQSEEWLE